MNTKKNCKIFYGKKAIICGLILYAAFFLIATVLISIVGVENYLTPAIFIIPIVVYLFSKFFYFRKLEPEKRILKGLLLGLYWLASTIVLDIILVVYGAGVGWVFFTEASWTLLVLYLEIISFSIVGALKK